MKTDKLIITKFEYAIMLTWHFDDKALLAQKINRNEHLHNKWHSITFPNEKSTEISRRKNKRH